MKKPYHVGGGTSVASPPKEAVAKTLEGHPHFMTPGGFVEIVDILLVPGT
jgi:hypothetical protein